MLDDHDTPLVPIVKTIVCCFCNHLFPRDESRLDDHSRRWCLPCYKAHVVPNLEKDPKIAKSPF